MRIGNETYDSVQDFVEQYLKNNREAELVSGDDDDELVFRMADGSSDRYSVSE